MADTDLLRAELSRAAQSLGAPADVEPILERPRDPAFGDWATNLAMFSVAGGIGQDKYEQSAVVRGTVTQGGVNVTAQAPGTNESLSRVNFFGDLAYNLPLLKIVAEIGHATGGTVETYNSFSGGRADQSYTYGSLGIRLSW